MSRTSSGRLGGCGDLGHPSPPLREAALLREILRRHPGSRIAAIRDPIALRWAHLEMSGEWTPALTAGATRGLAVLIDAEEVLVPGRRRPPFAGTRFAEILRRHPGSRIAAIRDPIALRWTYLEMSGEWTPALTAGATRGWPLRLTRRRFSSSPGSAQTAFPGDALCGKSSGVIPEAALRLSGTQSRYGGPISKCQASGPRL